MLAEPAGVLCRRAAVLHQQPGEQTERMAMAIVANAMTFHATLSASNLSIRSVVVESEAEGVGKGVEGGRDTVFR